MYNQEYTQEYRKVRQDAKQPPEKFILPPFEVAYTGTMHDYLESRALDYRLAIANGWYPAVVRRRPGVIIRSVSRAMPGLGFWQCRFFDDTGLRYDSPRGNRLDSLGLIQETIPVNTLVIVEGPMDALAAGMVPNCDGVATFGANPSDSQLEHLEKLTLYGNNGKGYDYVIVAPDKDAPEWAGKIVMALTQRKQYGILLQDETKDLSGLSLERRTELINQVKERFSSGRDL